MVFCTALSVPTIQVDALQGLWGSHGSPNPVSLSFPTAHSTMMPTRGGGGEKDYKELTEETWPGRASEGEKGPLFPPPAADGLSPSISVLLSSLRHLVASSS